VKGFGIKSIAFPGMGSGVGDLSLEKVSKTIVKQVRKHIDLRTSLREIVLVRFSDKLAFAFKVINEILGEH
jgi:O-acetyl-ADP-ribose deacetylase (regulator of RNase III)